MRRTVLLFISILLQEGRVGCGPQEEFRACSDVSIGVSSVIFPSLYPLNSFNVCKFSFLQVNFQQLHHYGQFVPGQNRQNREKLQMLQEVHLQPMSNISKNRFTTVLHDIWGQLSLFYPLFWLSYVYYLLFIHIIMTEVVSNNTCIGINNIKKHQRITCLHLNQLLSFLQHIPHVNLTHQYPRQEPNEYHKHSMK